MKIYPIGNAGKLTKFRLALAATMICGGVAGLPGMASAQPADCQNKVAQQLAELESLGKQIQSTIGQVGRSEVKRVARMGMHEVEFDANLAKAEADYKFCFGKAVDLHTPATTVNSLVVKEEAEIPDAAEKQRYHEFSRKYQTFLARKPVTTNDKN